MLPRFRSALLTHFLSPVPLVCVFQRMKRLGGLFLLDRVLAHIRVSFRISSAFLTLSCVVQIHATGAGFTKPSSSPGKTRTRVAES